MTPAELQQRRRVRLRASGLCIECRKPRDKSKWRCTSCLEKITQARKAVIASGGCGRCGKRRGNLRFFCDECAINQRIRNGTSQQLALRIVGDANGWTVADHDGSIIQVCATEQDAERFIKELT